MIPINRALCAANALSPNLMSAAERQAELCRILALGVVRLCQRQSSKEFTGAGESSLHFTASQSVGVDPLNLGAID